MSFRVTRVSDIGSSHAAAQDRTARDAVVRPLARAAERPCVRPGCPAPARASLSFRYQSREAWLERLSEEPRPESYDLCSAHAGRTNPPHGWQLRDRRPREEQVAGEPPTAPAGLGGEQTVAVLAAALRSVPTGPAQEPAPDTSTAHREATPAAFPAVGLAADDVTGTGRLEDTTSPVLEPPRPEVVTPSRLGDDGAATDPEVGHDPEVVIGAGDEPTVGDDPPADGEARQGEPSAASAHRDRVPRPVPAARDRLGTEHERAAGGPAQDW